MAKIKLCGLMTAQDAEYCNIVKPDLAGMVFAPGRRRTVSHEQAVTIRDALDASIPAVGVFIDARIAEIASLAERGIIQFVQLHGNEDNAYIYELRKNVDILIIQAFRVQSTTEMHSAERSDADIVLLDGGAGEGKEFNWKHLRYFTRPFFLAGGLNPIRVKHAIALHEPYGVDVSSGIETDGKKDLEKMQAFVDAVRSAG